MNKGHTPGPWKITQSGSFPLIVGSPIYYRHQNAEGPQTRICTMCNNFRVGRNHSTSEEDEANARLIAAAPNLLAALVNLIERVRLDMVEMQREGHTISHLAKSCNLAQMAITKAKGEGS